MRKIFKMCNRVIFSNLGLALTFSLIHETSLQVLFTGGRHTTLVSIIYRIFVVDTIFMSHANVGLHGSINRIICSD